MRTLTRLRQGAERSSVPCPTLTTTGIALRRGEVAMFAGQPGAGKSALALHVAVTSQVPTLYFCADTAAHTVTVRLLAMLTHLQQDVAEATLASDPDWAHAALAASSHIRWCFDSAPSLDDVDDEVEAYKEVLGHAPSLIVIDNLIDVSDGDDEWAAMRRTMKEIKFLARDTGAALLLLHHTSEAVKGHPCPPRSAIQGKVAQLPALIVTLEQEDGKLLLATVKNRYGPADPSGCRYRPLWFDPSTMFIGTGNG